MDGSGLTESLRPAPLQLDGIISGRDALSARKTASAVAAPSSGRSKTPPLLAMGSCALLLWLVPLAYSRATACSLCEVVAQVGSYGCTSVGVLGFAVAVLLHGWLRTLQRGEDCWWMRLCGQRGSMRALRGVLWLVDTGPGRAAPTDKRMTRAALARSGEMRQERADTGQIVFAGSSTFTYWNRMAEDWAPLPTLNVAFGGSSTAQVNAHFGRLIRRSSPAVIVYCCGSNDVLAGLTAVACLEGFKQFVALCREHAETRMCPIVYLGISTTPFHCTYGEERKAAIFSANELVHKYVKSEDTTPGGTIGPMLPPEVLAEVLPTGAAASDGSGAGAADSPFPEVEIPRGAGAGRQDGMSTWHAGMVAGAMAVAASMPAPAPAAGPEVVAAEGAGNTLITQNPTAEEQVGRSVAASGLTPPVRPQPTRGPLFFVDLDAASWTSDRSMYLGDGHHLNDAGHSALAELLKPIVEPLWRARTTG